MWRPPLYGGTGYSRDWLMLERFEDWWRADRDLRQQALMPLLERIEELDADIQAWVQVVPQFPTADGPLADIPFGVKDIIETAHLATEYGSPLYAGRLGTADADIVRRLRARGAVMVGKTETCAFACRTPARTRNPRNLAHTPSSIPDRCAFADSTCADSSVST